MCLFQTLWKDLLQINHSQKGKLHLRWFSLCKHRCNSECVCFTRSERAYCKSTTVKKADHNYGGSVYVRTGAKVNVFVSHALKGPIANQSQAKRQISHLRWCSLCKNRCNCECVCFTCPERAYCKSTTSKMAEHTYGGAVYVRTCATVNVFVSNALKGPIANQPQSKRQITLTVVQSM